MLMQSNVDIYKYVKQLYLSSNLTVFKMANSQELENYFLIHVLKRKLSAFLSLCTQQNFLHLVVSVSNRLHKGQFSLLLSFPEITNNAAQFRSRNVDDHCVHLSDNRAAGTTILSVCSVTHQDVERLHFGGNFVPVLLSFLEGRLAFYASRLSGDISFGTV